MQDFSMLTPDEFQSVMDAHTKAEEERSRERWECMRILAAVCVSPYSKRGVDPKKIVRLPWDDTQRPNPKPLTAAEDKARLTSLMERLKGKKA